MSNKIEYNPAQDLRYKLSLDDYSRERFKVLLNIQKRLQELLPEIPTSIQIFGSLTKGKVLSEETAKSADVDFNLFFDKEALNKLSEEEKMAVAQRLHLEDLAECRLYVFFTKIIVEEFHRAEQKTKIRSSIEKDPISGKWTPPTLKIYINSIKTGDIEKSVEEAKKIFNRLTDKKNLPRYLIFSVIPRFFCLSVGSAVKKYRNDFLRNLSNSSNDKVEAENTWSLVRDITRAFERKNNMENLEETGERQFPKTLADALKFYEVK